MAQTRSYPLWLVTCRLPDLVLCLSSYVSLRLGPQRAVGPILRRIFISKLGGFRASMCEYSKENHNQGSASQDFYWCCLGNSEVRALILQICEHKLCFGRQHQEKIWKYLKKCKNCKPKFKFAWGKQVKAWACRPEATHFLSKTCVFFDSSDVLAKKALQVQ